MKRESKELEKLLIKMYNICSSAQSSGRSTDKDAKRFNLGFWYDQAGRFLTTTSDQRQMNSTKEAQETVVRYSQQLKKYVQRFVQPLVDHSDFKLDGEIKEEMVRRKESYDWLVTRRHLAKFFCHPIYAASAPFFGFSGGVHKDSNDANFSLLLNFGAQARLDLPDYKCSVLLQPFDIVFLRSNSISHSTSKVDYPVKNPSKRWAISCFTRKKIAVQDEPDKDGHLLEFVQ
ncbi:hypothetical protein CBS101457_001825 [Exobasidium rhododendri]|nr:hypothetical protein CBS101457_001825 [Exobasidium rhododendri]